MQQKINKVIEIEREATSKGFEWGGNQGQVSKAERERKKRKRQERKKGEAGRTSDNDRERESRGGGCWGWERIGRVRPLHDNSFISKDLDREFSLYILISWLHSSFLSPFSPSCPPPPIHSSHTAPTSPSPLQPTLLSFLFFFLSTSLFSHYRIPSQQV